MHRNRSLPIIAPALAVILALSACGSDSEGASTTTRPEPSTTTTTTAAAPESDPTTGGAPTKEAFCADLQAAFGDFTPGFDAIFEEHPEPTLEDWAAFLPEPLADLDALVDRIEAVEPSADLVEQHAAVSEAFAAMAATFHDALDAAEAGDQAAYDAAETANQATNTPAVEQATGALGGACGFGS